MNIKHTFNKIDASDAVKLHAEERLKKLWPHLTKQDNAHFIYKKVRKHEYCVDLIISGHNKVFQASAKSTEDFYASIDQCVPRLMKQLAKKKDRLQHHRHSDLTREARLNRMSPEMEHDYSRVPGGGRRAA